MELKLVNPYFIKQLPGRKSDVKDARWIAECLLKNLIKGSFVPERIVQETASDHTRCQGTRSHSHNCGDRSGIKFLKGKISKEPYNSYYDDFYREFDCGWLGKYDKPQINQPQLQSEEDDENIVATREILKQYGIDVPNEKEREIADKENITRVPDPSEKKEWDDLPF